MQPLWIVQTNLGQTSDVLAFVDAVRRSGAAVEEVAHVPFSGTVPDIECGGAVVLYGAVGFVTAAAASGRWNPGVFGGPESYSYDAWARNYGPLLLNSPEDAERTTIGGFLSSLRDDGEMVFARPSEDTKSFDGSVRTVGNLRSFCLAAAAGGVEALTGDTEILVCRPHGIEAEFRLFVADGEIVTSSSYQRRGRTHVVADAPADVLAFGRAAAVRWAPSRLFVLDVCLSADNPYIVEAQSFNSAGHYAADLDALVDAASRIAVDMHDAPRVGWKPR